MKRIQFFWIGLMSMGVLTALSTSPTGKTLEQEVPASQIVKTLVKTHDVGNLWYTITNWGAYGNWGNSNYPSAEWPSDSDIEYLFGGALWIGAIVNNDTIVATGVEGWTVADETGSDFYEMFPGDAPGDTIMEACNVSNQDYIALYSDTVRAPYAPEHTPLGIEIHQNSYSWADTGYDDFIIFDYTVHNIDTFFLQDLYIGIYMDSDVGPNQGIRHEDDLSGFTDTLPTGDTVNIAWSKDDDGDGLIDEDYAAISE
ncbi:hypothetical protein IIA15_03600, partial [candidate division TA06 bacterium]|nr:hypothetical protein [candidate division TA06 bacterium]